jgi:hypothetical protein
MRLIPMILLAVALSAAGAAQASVCATGFHADLGGKCVQTLPCPGGFASGPNNRCAPVTHCAADATALPNGRCVATSQCPDGFTPSPTGCALVKRCADGHAPGLNERCPSIGGAPRAF